MKLAPRFHLSQVEQVAVTNRPTEAQLDLHFGLLEAPLSARRDDECNVSELFPRCPMSRASVEALRSGKLCQSHGQ